MLILGLLSKMCILDLEWHCQVKKNTFPLCSMVFQSMCNVKFRTLFKSKWYQRVLLVMQIFSLKTIDDIRVNENGWLILKFQQKTRVCQHAQRSHLWSKQAIAHLKWVLEQACWKMLCYHIVSDIIICLPGPPLNNMQSFTNIIWKICLWGTSDTAKCSWSDLTENGWLLHVFRSIIILIEKTFLSRPGYELDLSVTSN